MSLSWLAVLQLQVKERNREREGEIYLKIFTTIIWVLYLFMGLEMNIFVNMGLWTKLLGY